LSRRPRLYQSCSAIEEEEEEEGGGGGRGGGGGGGEIIYKYSPHKFTTVITAGSN